MKNDHLQQGKMVCKLRERKRQSQLKLRKLTAENQYKRELKISLKRGFHSVQRNACNKRKERKKSTISRPTATKAMNSAEVTAKTQG